MALKGKFLATNTDLWNTSEINPTLPNSISVSSGYNSGIKMNSP